MTMLSRALSEEKRPKLPRTRSRAFTEGAMKALQFVCAGYDANELREDIDALGDKWFAKMQYTGKGKTLYAVFKELEERAGHNER